MTKYECCDCGMGVEGLTCSKCGAALVHNTLTKDDGSTVDVSQCPDGCGKIKSPMCCDHDMDMVETQFPVINRTQYHLTKGDIYIALFYWNKIDEKIVKKQILFIELGRLS